MSLFYHLIHDTPFYMYINIPPSSVCTRPMSQYCLKPTSYQSIPVLANHIITLHHIQQPTWRRQAQPSSNPSAIYSSVPYVWSDTETPGYYSVATTSACPAWRTSAVVRGVNSCRAPPADTPPSSPREPSSPSYPDPSS